MSRLACISFKQAFIGKSHSKHGVQWLKDAPMVRAPRRRHYIPAEPPSIFQNVPHSSIPTSTLTTPRPAKKAKKDARKVDIDEVRDFLEQDTI
ncbi:hypothetical protein PoB_002544900 [Plakobranchus ocellatus]|uniref:Uncharacterized protein n=1 Tax=Plakobranchus ocellatus TaxID=259542 RepID=A0AAV3ZX08_9GAST|nr:hypothetical protein PoB_002544900 [Plakobranchus ocellatus]